MATGSELAVPLNVTREQYIIDLFNVARTRDLLRRRRKPSDELDAAKILEALVAWDEEVKGANTHQLSVRYNELLDAA